MNSQPTVRPILRLLVVLLASVFVAAACGSSDDSAAGDAGADSGQTESESSSETDDSASGATDDGAMTDGAMAEDGAASGFPRTIETATGPVSLDAKPTSIVSLSATATEMLFAIGAGDLVSAVDFYSNYPSAAPEGSLDAFTPDLEAILAYEPQLVIATGLPEDVVAGLAASGVEIMIHPTAASFDDTYDQIAQLGEATDQIDEAAALNAEIRQGIDEVIASLPVRDEPIRVFHEIDDTFYTATSASFIGQVYSEMGFENIADPLDDGSGFPLVDGESVIAANPSLVVFTSQPYYDADDIAARPGWDGVSAVAQGNVVEVDADIASRWGPRIVEFMQTIADVVSANA